MIDWVTWWFILGYICFIPFLFYLFMKRLYYSCFSVIEIKWYKDKFGLIIFGVSIFLVLSVVFLSIG